MKSFAVIPAAGQSRRMGQPKLLLPWGKQRVMDAVLTAWQNSQVTNIVVVLRSDDEELISLCQDAGVETVAVPSPTADMKASVQTGLQYIFVTHSPAATDVWLMAPADLPRLSSKVIDHVLAAHRPSASRPIVPTDDGRRGHPALFPWPFALRVDELNDHQGINIILRDSDVLEVECPGAAPADLDTPKDYLQ